MYIYIYPACVFFASSSMSSFNSRSGLVFRYSMRPCINFDTVTLRTGFLSDSVLSEQKRTPVKLFTTNTFLSSRRHFLPTQVGNKL